MDMEDPLGFSPPPPSTLLDNNGSLTNCTVSWDNVTDCLVNEGGNGTNGTNNSLFYFYEVEQLTFLWVLFFMIVIGNSAVLAALILAKTPRKSRMNFFIMHLALADLAVGLINVLTDIIWKMTVAWYAGNIACKLVRFFQTVVLYSSNYVLVALSIDRYDAITHPLNFGRSWRRARLLVATAWILSVIFAIPALLIFHEKEMVHNGDTIPQCWAHLEEGQWQVYLTLVFLVLFLCPALIIAVCYTIMVHTIWTQSRILTPSLQTSNKNGTLRKSTFRSTKKQTTLSSTTEDDSKRASSRGNIPKAKIKSVKMTFVIVFVFILCSSPYFVFNLLQVYRLLGTGPNSPTVYAIATFFQSLSPLNSAANPIIYCLFATHICRNLRKIRLVNWLALKLCPRLGKSSPSRGHKFGPNHNHHNFQHDLSGKTRSEFTTSMTESSVVNKSIHNSSRNPAHTRAQKRASISTTTFIEDKVRP